MKKIFSPIAVLFFISATSQVPYYNFKKHLDQNKQPQLFKKEIRENKSSRSYLDLVKSYSYHPHQARLLSTLSNGNKIYSLPQDYMYCIVPDLSQYFMPNISKEEKLTGMPPGILPPYKIIPEKIP